MKINDIPVNFKVIKPWGTEYTIYKNLTSSTKLLRLKKNKSTSLHCHPIKKTGFILIKGEVSVDLGFYNTKKLTPLSRLMIRPGLFHCTRNINNKEAVILEIETPIDKDDLVRFKDNYGRQDKPYEDSKSMVKLKNEQIFEDPKLGESIEYIIEDLSIKIVKTDNIKKLKNSKKNSIIAVLDGGLVGTNQRYVLSPGDIVGIDTVKKLSEVFKIKKYITYFEL